MASPTADETGRGGAPGAGGAKSDRNHCDRQNRQESNRLQQHPHASLRPKTPASPRIDRIESPPFGSDPEHTGALLSIFQDLLTSENNPANVRAAPHVE